MFKYSPFLLTLSLLSSCAIPGLSFTPELELLPETGQLSPAFDPEVHHYEISSLSTLRPFKFQLKSARALSATLDGKSIPLNQPTEVTVDRLAADRQLKLEVSFADHSESYQIQTLPASFPKYTLAQPESAALSPGWILSTPQDWSGKNPAYLLILNPKSEPVYYLQSSMGLADFKQQDLPDGTRRYSYFSQTQNSSMVKVGYSEGKLHVLDQNLNEIERLSLLPYSSPLYKEYYPAMPADSHDSLLLGQDDYILEAYYGKEVDNIPAELLKHPGQKIKVAAAIIQEVRDGQVIFEWDSTHYPEFYKNTGIYSAYDSESPDWYDYMHINSICIDPKDQNLIVSFRHQNQIVKLDRSQGTILWRLGGKNSDFVLTPEQQFSHQHHAELLPDGQLQIFDNANPPDGSGGTGQTKVMRFKLDEAAHQVLDFKSWQPLPQQYAYAMGSAQLLGNGNILAGWGANQKNSDITEIDAQGQVLYDLSFDETVYSYRAFKYPQL